MSQNVFKAVLLIETGAQRANFVDESEMLQSTTYNHRQLIGMYRLGKIVISPELHGLDCGLHCSECGQNDNDHLRVLRPDKAKKFNARGSGHLKISDDKVERT